MPAVAGLLVLVVILPLLLDQRRTAELIAQTERDVQTVRIGAPITEVLPALPGFTQLVNVPVERFGSEVATVYRKSVGRKSGTGREWDIGVDAQGRVERHPA